MTAYNDRFKLSYHAGSRMWSKFYKGKARYILSGTKDQQTYRAAMTKWTAMKAEIDGLTVSPFVPNTIDVSTAPGWPKPMAMPTVETRTIESVRDQFMAERHAEVTAGEVSVSRVAGQGYSLAEFLTWSKGQGYTSIAAVNELMIAEFKVHTLGNEKIAKVTRAHRFFDVRQFIQWGWRRSLIATLPRNLDELRVKAGGIPIKEVQTFTVEQVRTMYRNATLRTKAFLLLGLQCGFTQSDISALDWSMIGEDGVLDTLRCKTARHGCRQRHKLWGVTLTVLEQCKAEGLASKSGRVFVDAKSGGAMLKEKCGAKYQKTD